MITYIKVNETIIHLADTTGSLSGYCPYCDARCHASTSSKGVRFLARDAGQIHTNPECIILSSQLKTPDISVTNFTSFFSDVLRGTKDTSKDDDTENQKPNPDDDHDNDNNDNNDNNNDKNGEKNEEAKLVPIRSLNAVIKSQVMLGGPDQKTGDGKYIADYILRPSWLLWARDNNVNLNGCKIYEAFFVKAIEKNNTILYQIKWNNYGVETYMRLQLHADDKTFKAFVNKYCEYINDELNRTILVPKKEMRRMLVAGVWNEIDCSWKKCNQRDEIGCQSCLGNLSSAATSIRQFIALK